MPLIQKLIDNNELFNNLTKEPVIVNDLPNSTVEERNYIERLVTTRYSSDMISLLPSCQCGSTKGEFTKEQVCPSCGTVVTSNMEDSIEPLIWFRKPKGVEALINPLVGIMLRDRLHKSGFSILRWMMDTMYSPMTRKPPVLTKLIEAGIKRGYNNFVRNFDEYMDIIFSIKEFKSKDPGDRLMDFMAAHRSCFFSDYIPLINKALLIVENTSFGVYIDNNVPKAVDAINMLMSIDKDFPDQSGFAKENRTAKALLELFDFYSDHIRNVVSKKPGTLRKHGGGCRFDYSGYVVISSITSNIVYDEVLPPWGLSIAMFRPMLYNKLTNKSGMSTNEAVGFLYSHIHKYHPLIDTLFQEIIAESRDGRYPIIATRFPSLLQGSTQRVFIPRVKTDPMDKTLGVPIVICPAWNADFDGKILLSLNLSN